MTQESHSNYETALAQGDHALNLTNGAKEQNAALQVAQVHATLAQVDAIEALTAVLERMQFPALEIKKAGSGLSTKFAVTPYPTRRAS